MGMSLGLGMAHSCIFLSKMGFLICTANIGKSF